MSPVPANNREVRREEEDDDISMTDTPQFALPNSDSDSDAGDSDTDGHQGYQLLPQDPDGVIDDEQDVTTGSPSATAPVVAPQPPSAIDTAIMESLDHLDMMNAVAPQDNAEEDAPPSERTEVWNSPPLASAASIPMDADHMERIRSAMSGFSLPPSAQPPWAGQLSDDDWTTLIQHQGTVSAIGASGKQQQTARKAQHNSTRSRDKTVDR